MAANAQSLREKPSGLALAIATTSLAGLALLVFAPLAVVLWEAFAEGIATFVAAVTDEDTLSALFLTVLVVAIVVPFQTVFGVAAAWLLTRQDFRGKAALGTLIDLPFTVSPVVSGLLFVLLFGARGWFGPWLRDHDIRARDEQQLEGTRNHEAGKIRGAFCKKSNRSPRAKSRGRFAGLPCLDPLDTNG